MSASFCVCCRDRSSLTCAHEGNVTPALTRLGLKFKRSRSFQIYRRGLLRWSRFRVDRCSDRGWPCDRDRRFRHSRCRRRWRAGRRRFWGCRSVNRRDGGCFRGRHHRLRPHGLDRGRRDHRRHLGRDDGRGLRWRRGRCRFDLGRRRLRHTQISLGFLFNVRGFLRFLGQEHLYQ